MKKPLRIIGRIWGICRPFHRTIYGILGILLLNAGLGALLPITLGMNVSAVTKGDYRSFMLAIIVWLAIRAGQVLTTHFREIYELGHLDFKLSEYLSQISMKKFFEISMGQHHVGNSIIRRSVMAKGEAAINSMVYTTVYEAVPILFTITLPILFLLVYAWQVGLVVLFAIILFVVYTVKFNLRFMKPLRELDSLGNTSSKKHGEVVQNADVVYVNSQETRIQGECGNVKAKEGEKGRPLWKSYVKYFHGGQFGLAIPHGIAIVVAGTLTIGGSFDPGMFVTLWVWIGSSLNSVSNASHIQRQLAKNVAPIVKYLKFIDYEPDITMPTHPVPLENFRGRIEFRHVGFTYSSRVQRDVVCDGEVENDDEVASESKPPALIDVSFVLEEGKRYAFVGKSGAGKSTLVSLILRAFDPQNGHILADGVDIRMLDYKELRKRIGLVPQDVLLFDETLRYNITFGLNGHSKEVTDDQLGRIAKLSRISEFWEKLEKGWNTLIGERGIKLSGGQRQRVGIGRALIKNPHILIFDEATSSLDTENEAGIRESIREASVGKTTIIIAHRLATVKDADKIFVFDEGRVVGEGTHEELLHANEYYQRLVNNQVIIA